MKLRILIATLALSLGACQTIENPQQAVFAARATHNTLLIAVVAYAQRPSCAQPMPPLVCARAEVAIAMDKADDAAAAVLDAAETTVRTSGFGDDVYASAAASATAAIRALSTIIAAYR